MYTETSPAGRAYAAAYEVHYINNDLHNALELYRKIVKVYPDTAEARYAKLQIEKIMDAVVPEQEGLNFQMDLASARFEKKDKPDESR
jgi:hypothetical protein